MIGPKLARPTPAEERDAYELATLRDSDTCQRCRRAQGTNRDHRKNRSQGGHTVASNLQLLCGTGTTGCHGWVTSHPADAVADGWAVPGWADWREWPARRWVPGPWGALRLAWVLYDDEGAWVEIPEYEAHERMGGA
ncbi:HNH endonuclease [Agromyces sp. NBRC 114283]|uniref:HNH endonuclease n=1 Tax=Agromyces sp. NBRC 114283 TaxID=2994521 RepID=UPI0024A3CC53|nr:HNH endonuclease [Agromyces sp. NBRC 114283]GLU91318.1 hypothetical protein Agsp01_35730 [Agromyces sp. NBRC 114283]